MVESFRFIHIDGLNKFIKTRNIYREDIISIVIVNEVHVLYYWVDQ